ncbi:hypothetical protein M758_11G077500 [Ceratodon purpureus]|uniref:Uncharacterized protein n=1 Tax=Ceratodon purpureus TaxID=3225 RepID=A0A8T0GC86_CERPU|nr:hypothetical protein KC19_11G080100 [Ceratodon purpureus]KAG0601015.1 hypothetical protein M758_11G077500 [Ceratodon purpureus]
MGGGSEDQFLEGSVLGASFWGWWNRAWTGEPDGRRGEDSQRAQPAKPESASPVASEELVLITTVVPRPRPPSRPVKSKPIDIPTRKPVSTVPIFESVPEDKRYWYQ